MDIVDLVSGMCAPTTAAAEPEEGPASAPTVLMDLPWTAPLLTALPAPPLVPDIRDGIERFLVAPPTPIFSAKPQGARPRLRLVAGAPPISASPRERRYRSAERACVRPSMPPSFPPGAGLRRAA
jgi:hypothetical protein